MAQPFWLPENASPKFRQALELLIQAHVEELAKSQATNEELVPAKPQNNSTVIVSSAPDANAKSAMAAGFTERPVDKIVGEALPVGTQGGGTENEVTEALDDDAPKGLVAYLRSLLMGVSVNPHGHSNEVAMFGNVKEQLQDKHEIDEFEYDVANFYKTTGCAQSLARSDWFGYVALSFICANAIYLGVDSDLNRAESINEAELPFIICENIFCVFFTLEVLVRFLAFASKRDCLRDNWFVFDSVLVFIMVMETWVLFLIGHLTGGKSPFPTGPMKLLRLLKLARIVRILRSFPELMTMVKGMIVATKPVSSSMCMLIGIIYVFAITMHLLCRDDEEVFMYWGTVSRCMMTLLANGTLGDSIGTITRGIARNAVALCVFFIFVILSAVTVTNMLIGVLCEVVSHVAEAEKEYAALAKLKKTLLVMLKNLDQDGSGDISKNELMQILDHPDALLVLADLEISVKFFVDLLDMIYETTETCTVPEIMQLLLDNQGQRTPVLKDIVFLHNFTRWSLKREIRQSIGALALTLPRMETHSGSAQMLMPLSNSRTGSTSTFTL